MKHARPGTKPGSCEDRVALVPQAPVLRTPDDGQHHCHGVVGKGVVLRGGCQQQLLRSTVKSFMMVRSAGVCVSNMDSSSRSKCTSSPTCVPLFAEWCRHEQGELKPALDV